MIAGKLMLATVYCSLLLLSFWLGGEIRCDTVIEAYSISIYSTFLGGKKRL